VMLAELLGDTSDFHGCERYWFHPAPEELSSAQSRHSQTAAAEAAAATAAVRTDFLLPLLALASTAMAAGAGVSTAGTCQGARQTQAAGGSSSSSDLGPCRQLVAAAVCSGASAGGSRSSSC